MIYKTYKSNGITFLRATNEVGLSLLFCPIGAAIKSISVDNNELFLTPKSVQNFLSSDNLLGKTINPLFDNDEIDIRGDKYQLKKNFQISRFYFNAKPLLDNNYFYIQYSFSKKKMEDGLPGNINYYISYTMSNTKNELLVDYRAISDTYTPAYISNIFPFLLSDIATKEDGKVVLENDDYQIEISSNEYVFEVVNHQLIQDDIVKSALLISPREKGLYYIDKDKQYHRQIIYRFIRKRA